MTKRQIRTVSYFMTAMALTGMFLNSLQSRTSFLIWTPPNLWWAFVGLHNRNYAQTIMFVVYQVFCIWGWFNWG